MVSKVAHLTSVHRAFDNRIMHKECQSLAQAGYDTVLIAPHDEDTRYGEVRVHAIPYPNGRFARFTRTVFQVYRAAVHENVDLYHFHDPELIPVGLLLKLRGKRVIYDVHEDVPRQIKHKPWIARPIRSLIAGLAAVVEQIGALTFDAIVTATPHIARRFPPRKTRTVHNFTKLDENPADCSQPYAERSGILCYVGAISATRGAQQMLQAVALVPEHLHAQLVLGGKFQPDQFQQALQQEPGWQRTEFRGWLTRSDVAAMLCEARIGLCVLHATPAYVESYPTKVFEYMAAGIPVVASDFPLWRQIIGDAGCGLLVDPMTPQAIADAIQWLLENPAEAEAMGQRGRTIVAQKYSWENEARTLLAVYDQYG